MKKAILSAAARLVFCWLLPSACSAVSGSPADQGPALGGAGGASAEPVEVPRDDCDGSCGSGQTCCEGECVDLSTSVSHCGGCGLACPTSGGIPTCDAGECEIECDVGHLDCDGRVENGCEEVDPGPPSRVQLERPILGAFTGTLWASDVHRSLRPTFRFAEATGACGRVTYQLEVDDSCPIEDFAECPFESPEVDELTAEPMVALDDDLPVSREVPVGSRYFWRVRACDDLERCSDYGEVRYLDVGRDRQDVTGDGYADIILLDESQYSARYTVYAGGPGLGTSPLGEPQPLSATVVLEHGVTRESADSEAPVVRFVGDVNGDAYQDFVADWKAVDYGEAGGPTSTSVHCPLRLLYLGDPTGMARGVAFTTRSWAPTGFAHSFAAGDFDADGYADIWAAQSVELVPAAGQVPAQESGVFLVRGRPDLAPTPAVSVVGTWFAGPRPDDDGDYLGISMEPGDFDGDGRVDVAMVVPAAMLVYLILGGTEQGVVARAIPYGGAGAVAPDCRQARLSVGDFNADAFDDFAVNCPEQRLVEAYFGGNPLPNSMAFQRVVNPSSARGPVDTAAADFDADGTFELLVGGDPASDRTPAWLFSGLDSPGAEEMHSIATALNATYLSSGDHNGDGHLDLLVAGTDVRWIPGWGSLDEFRQPVDPTASVPVRVLLGSTSDAATRTLGR